MKNTKKRVIVISISVVGLALIGVFLAFRFNKTNNIAKKETVIVAKKDAYIGFSKAVKSQIKNAALAVDVALHDKATAKASEQLQTDLDAAAKKVAVLGTADVNLNTIKQTLTDVLTVIKLPTIDNLQLARSSINNLANKELKILFQKAYEEQLIAIVATTTKQTPDTVKTASAPLNENGADHKRLAMVEAEKKAIAEKKAAEVAAAKKKADAKKAAATLAAAQAKEDAQQASAQDSYDADYQAPAAQAGTTQDASQSSDGLNQAERDHKKMTDAYDAAVAAGEDLYYRDQNGNIISYKAAEGYVMGEWQP